MRCDEVARGVVVMLDPLEGGVEVAPLASGELLGDMLLGELLLLGDVVLDASGDVVLGGVVGLLGAGCVRLTSPPEVLFTAPLGAAALLGMQSVVVAELEVAPLVEVDMPLGVVVDADMLPFADTRTAVVSARVAGVVPVPFAPFVLFRPVKR